MRNRVESNLTNKFREYPDIPLTWPELSWHDKRFIEEYLCNRTRLYYKQELYYDLVVGTSYTETFEFDLSCELLDIGNSKIRLHYWVPINDDSYRSSFYNSWKDDLEYSYNDSTVFYWRSTGFSAQIRNEFHKDLHGLKSWYALFHTKIGKDLTRFNNWNFSSDTSSKWWDSIEHGFWFDEGTTMLIGTVHYFIGQEQIQNAYIRL